MSQVDKNISSAQQAEAGDTGPERYLFGLAGWSGSGKTTLAIKLITWFAEAGYSVGTIKHAHHEFDADIEGKDSWRHRKAGAEQVIISSDNRTVHFTEHQHRKPPTLSELLAEMTQPDIILVEGFKTEPIAKIEIYRPELGKPALYPDDSNIRAVISSAELSDCGVDRLSPNDPEKIAQFILSSGFFSYHKPDDRGM